MKNKRAWVIAIGLVVLLTGCRDKNEEPLPYNLGNPIDFRLDTLDHQRFYLNAYRGKVVVLAFWSTGCVPCKTELLELKSLVIDPRFGEVVFAAVCTDPEDRDNVESIIKSLDINYPVLLDKQAGIFNQLNLSTVPATLVVDQGGRVHLTRLGFDASILRQINKSIEQLLAAEDGL